MKILIVDDDRTQKHLLKYHLNKLGLTDITEAGDGKTALNLLNNSKFDLVIADWHMPQMDGIDLYKNISSGKNPQDIPFLMITCEADKDKVVKAFKSGIRNYLVKPFDSKELVEKVKSMLNLE